MKICITCWIGGGECFDGILFSLREDLPFQTEITDAENK